jgi:hypothetical protein
LTEFQVFAFGLVPSFGLGLLTSFFIWWLTAHYWKPEIEFSQELCEYELPSGKNFFQSAFKNVGKRDIVDLEIQVRIGIKEFWGATGWAFHTVKPNTSRVPLLSSEKHRRVQLFDMRESIKFIDRPSESIRLEIEKCQSLRDILILGQDASVTVHVFGYDSFSGARKHFSSPAYRVTDIRKGTFDGLDVVQNTRFKRK